VIDEAEVAKMTVVPTYSEDTKLDTDIAKTMKEFDIINEGEVPTTDQEIVIRKKYSQLRNSFKSMKSKKEELDSKNNDLQIQEAKLERDVSTREIKIQAVTAQLKAEEAINAKLDRKVILQRKKIDAKESELEATKSINTGLKEGLLISKTKLRSYTDLSHKLDKNVHKDEGSIDMLTEQIATINKKLSVETTNDKVFRRLSNESENKLKATIEAKAEEIVVLEEKKSNLLERLHEGLIREKGCGDTHGT
jgi:chromosome segregation ATPase